MNGPTSPAQRRKRFERDTPPPFQITPRDIDLVRYVAQQRYTRAQMLSTFDFDALLTALELGTAYVDFDARTGHNHGTKFRVRASALPGLYKNAVTIFG